MSFKLQLKNKEGEVTRYIFVEGEEGVVVLNESTRRVEVLSSTEELEALGIDFIELARVTEASLAQPLWITNSGVLTLADKDEKTLVNVPISAETSQLWWRAFGSVFVATAIFMVIILNVPRDTPEIEEELKQHIVKIIKRAPKMEQSTSVVSQISKKKTEVKRSKRKKKSIKRLGALAVLGRLNKRHRNKGGVNLGATTTSSGPGLWGSQGSGGTQKSLYGKGLIAAPVGAGQNIKGAGGYGTKGRGGGRDGYGKLNLVGSSGAALIPLGKEVIVHGGLEQDLIASVIQKNMGQIRFCYEQGLQANPKLTGRVAVDFTIGSNGGVNAAGLRSTTLHSKFVEDCILLRLRTWKFPLPEGGVNVKVSYPFLLRRLGRG